MMKAMLPMFVVACCTTALAQTPDPAKQTPMKTPAGDVTVAGCVAEGSAGQFMLNNATMMPGPAKKEPAPPTSAMPTTGGKSTTTSYMLVGGENLKAHVGHKVEVSGTLSAHGMPGTGATGTTGKPEEKTATGAMKAPELRVQSVKMVSTTCP